jgi:hypothetical protein
MENRRPDFVRPITVAIAFTLLGELLIFYIWGIQLFPEGIVWKKLVWTITCGIAMGATIGAFVNITITGRLHGTRGGVVASLIYFSVLAFCVGLCYQIDLVVRFFGAREFPLLFILGGLVPALITSIAYSWLLFSAPGQSTLSKIGL